MAIGILEIMLTWVTPFSALAPFRLGVSFYGIIRTMMDSGVMTVMFVIRNIQIARIPETGFRSHSFWIFFTQIKTSE